jgi:hypothetical protein
MGKVFNLVAEMTLTVVGIRSRIRAKLLKLFGAKGIEPSYSAWKSPDFRNVFKGCSDIFRRSGRLRMLRNFSLSEWWLLADARPFQAICRRLRAQPLTTDQEPIWTIKNQSGGLDFGIITSIELSTPRRQHLGTGETVILTVTKLGSSETMLWRARAGQARRVAGMLSPRDAALLEVYARECARAAFIESARANTRLSVRARETQ